MKQMELVTRDDFEGTADARTIEFAIEGKTYEVDLNEANAARLHAALAEFVAVARPVVIDVANETAVLQDVIRTRPKATKTKAPKATAKKVQGEEQLDSRAVRRWAAQNGIALAPRGPISSSIIDQYKAYRAEVEAPKPRRVDFRDLRKWAAANGIEVPATGSIDPVIVERYRLVQLARKVTKASQGKIKTASKAPAVRARGAEAQDVRDWAAKNGIAVAPRGPISSAIIDMFKADQPSTTSRSSRRR